MKDWTEYLTAVVMLGLMTLPILYAGYGVFTIYGKHRQYDQMRGRCLVACAPNVWDGVAQDDKCICDLTKELR